MGRRLQIDGHATEIIGVLPATFRFLDDKPELVQPLRFNRAKVTLGLRVLSYNDLSFLDPGYYLFLAHQVVKEAMAAVGSLNAAGSLEGALGFDLKLGA